MLNRDEMSWFYNKFSEEKTSVLNETDSVIIAAFRGGVCREEIDYHDDLYSIMARYHRRACLG